MSAHDYESAGKPLIAWDDPVAKAALVNGLVSDALALLDAFGRGPSDTETAAALGLLALVAGQDVEPGDDGTWRIAQRVAPDRMISTVDPEARHMHKTRSEYRDGYKAHIAIEPETGIITAAKLTPANPADAKTAIGLLASIHRLTSGECAASDCGRCGVSMMISSDPGACATRGSWRCLGCQRVGDRLRPRRSARVVHVGTKVTARRLVSARAKELAQGQRAGARRVGRPERLTSRPGTAK